MKKVQKILIMLLALTMCFLAACGEDPVVTSENSSTEPSAPTAPTTQALMLVADEASDYQIVYAANGKSWEKSAALRLQRTILAATGVEIPVVKDTDGAASAKEIILATPDNNRRDTYTAKETGYNLGYSLFVDESRLIFEIGSQTGAFFAVSHFSKDHFGFDLEAGETAKRVEGMTVLSVAPDYSATRTLHSVEFPYLGIPLSNFDVGYDSDHYIQKCMAAELRSELTILDADLYLWDFSYGTEAGKSYFSFEQDDSLVSGCWEIRIREDGIVLAANGFFGFESAVASFTKERSPNGYFDFRAGDVISGDYRNDLSPRKEVDQVLKYAYDNLGEYRVMFYNVLFYSGSGEFYYPEVERNRLQAEMIGEYMPDVLGCQEFNGSRRYGIYALPELLKELGYAESVDPRVKNAYPTDQKIPGTDSLATTGTNEGVELNGYGTTGADPVTVNGESYFTYYNNTPLFYNTKTTKCIASEYYWYKNQYDVRPGSNHPNTANDCGSKSLTWGVFESLETGERYIAVSTHMCTRSDYVRGLQAQEVVDLIAELVAEYNCPVLFGGDMNGNLGDSNYGLFMSEEVGYVSLQDDKIAEKFTSNLLANHGYPNHNGVVLTPGRDATVAKEGESIDQIFLTNYEEKLTVKVFGVIADYCAMRGSDHFPIFADFSID